MSPDEKLPLEGPEAEVSRWLGILNQTAVPKVMRDIATKHVAQAFMEERLANSRQTDELAYLRAELAETRSEVAALLTWKTEALKFENSMASLMLERERPKEVQTSVTASPPRLALVRPEGA